MRLALSLSAVTLVGGLVVPVLTLAGTARADVHPADQAQETLTVTKRDATGDVHLDRSGRRAPHRVTGSVDLSAARYRIDRTEETLTVTYPVRRILARGSDYTQFFASIATVDKAQDDAVASAVFITSLRHPGRVEVDGTDADGDAFTDRCAAASVTVSRAQDTLTQQVPFSCFEGAFDHAYLRSAAFVETRRGADLAWDATRYTRDLPLSPAG
ncbi:MAG: hypothetical protein H6529_18590 [Nocardioides sp.]|nr:hypothetical protein [Nocardioidaceae bacterium]MCB8958470.1 hypothetical protein [Nocardioides sp.]